ncbi:probable fructose-2,6-bisphosphatase TIGAR A isoform X4 [Phyllopteryx taeniolatus]|uniref:probable fructose-2,6-bisphosphatase TIGAR A isoform X4 n=1 Tax=Phyllopteryx taeniolatus TaxID=161469 RepID=UPI002AD4E174|nr:probable fructose-2,6-bisphosphatase TIGAR A isoform X4 [Phyllopteryx taeniolatus]
MERKRKKKRGFYRNGGKTVALQNGLASILTPVCSTLGLPGSPGVHLCACSCETPSQGVQSSSHWMRKACCLVDGLQEMKSLMLGLTFVRHGETQFNKEGLLQGQAIDCPLSEVGLQQAEAAGRYLTDVKFSNLFVSDMLRARQTAETIVKHNSSCAGLQLACDPLLKEKSFGIAEGKRVQDIKDMAKAAGQSLAIFTPPQGETQEQVSTKSLLSSGTIIVLLVAQMSQ